ncbi:hypothetical protein FACS1894139_13300 [Planctomycetales bacterium]|nr:hypothetical protein FACS1894107_09670 [Planctomycetales bacterium]GHT01452.1 hypothetical protein FACS1894108_15190 [Planctomycetales bacterium]GHT06743.1 hypothetical protein FACS1894139_13300 [Planctomycetales bacterium]
MKTSVAMTAFGNLFVSNVLVWSAARKKYEPIFLAWDTGASVTTISASALKILGYDLGGKKRDAIITASGRETVKVLTLDKIKIAAIELSNVEVRAHEFPRESFLVGVIGLNVMRDFDVNFVFSRGVVELTQN